MGDVAAAGGLPRCGVTGKVSHPSKDAARAYLAGLPKGPGWVAQDVYRCPFCGWVHTASRRTAPRHQGKADRLKRRRR